MAKIHHSVDSAPFHFCPACWIERTDYEGPGAHLPECPNCGAEAAPVPPKKLYEMGYEDGWRDATIDSLPDPETAYQEGRRDGWDEARAIL